MSLIVTPGQLFRRADFYHRLSQLLSAGLGLPQALKQIERHPPSRSYRAASLRLLKAIDQGYTFSEALQLTRGWLPEFDVALLEAGEKSGRLDRCLSVLEEYYAERGRMMRQMLFSLAYPIGLFHFAVLIFAFVRYVSSWDLIGSILQILITLLPLYIIGGTIVFIMQGQHGEVWRGWVEKFLRPIPILGTARRELALSRLALALEALISAGVSIIDAWDLAAAVSGSPALRETVHAWRADVRAGTTPAEALTASGKFPELFANQYMTGELSGKLDEVLRRLSRYYRDEGTRKIDALAQWTPRVIYLVIALAIAWWIVSFYMGRIQQLQNIMNGF